MTQPLPDNNMEEARDLLREVRVLLWKAKPYVTVRTPAESDTCDIVAGIRREIVDRVQTIDAFLKNDLEEAPSNSGSWLDSTGKETLCRMTGASCPFCGKPLWEASNHKIFCANCNCDIAPASTSLKEEHQRAGDPVINELDAYHFPTEESLVKAAHEMCSPPASTESKSLKSGEEIRMLQDCRSLYEFLLWNLCRTEPYPIIDFKLRAEKVIDDDGDTRRVLVRFYIHADGVDSQTPVFTLEEPACYGMCRDYQISDLIHFGSWYQKSMEVPHMPKPSSTSVGTDG